MLPTSMRRGGTASPLPLVTPPISFYLMASSLKRKVGLSQLIAGRCSRLRLNILSLIYASFSNETTRSPNNPRLLMEPGLQSMASRIAFSQTSPRNGSMIDNTQTSLLYEVDNLVTVLEDRGYSFEDIFDALDEYVELTGELVIGR
uniref:Major capsid protein n=1 Tax=uncultured marine virus TaxID=186617 RepID=A0A0F7LBZ9_9VIRU|nr:major capsid protein [uncultured marine virus]